MSMNDTGQIGTVKGVNPVCLGESNHKWGAGTNSPKPASPVFPFPGHRSIFEADRQERTYARSMADLEAMDDWNVERVVDGKAMARASAKFLKALNRARAK